jgi:ADP-ribose pyrophosphatase YjhB (NUDIX family)
MQRQLQHRVIRPAMQAWWRMSRGLTLGVRGVATDEAGRVMLIRHGYTPGWQLPGGGVERGQTAEQALHAEFMEEAGIEMTGPAVLFAVYSNARIFRNDHVLLYRLGPWRPCPPSASTREIAERGFFALSDLPNETTRATRARLDEVFDGAARDVMW